MSSRSNSSTNLFKYSYIDLEGNKYGPFEGSKMAEWDLKGHMDDDLVIFRISASGQTSDFILGELKKHSRAPFLEVDPFVPAENEKLTEVKSESRKTQSIKRSHISTERNSQTSSPREPESQGQFAMIKISPSIRKFNTSINNSESLPLVGGLFKKTETIRKVGCSSITNNSSFVPFIRPPVQQSPGQNYHPLVFSAPPFMRMPDSRFPIMNPESARLKVFSLYQLVITVPEQVKHFPPYTTETVSCQLCKCDLTGSEMFKHLISIQHLMKVSNCMFTESDVDFWISRVNNVVRHAPASAIILPGFEAAIVNETESITDFINRTKGFVRKPSGLMIEKVVDATLSVEAATSCSSSNSNRSKRKLTGSFLSRVVEALIVDVDRTTFQRRYGKLMKKNSNCTFCNTHFGSLYDACCHVGTALHGEKISNVLYHEGHVATLVRLLARPVGPKSVTVSRENALTDSRSLNIVHR